MTTPTTSSDPGADALLLALTDAIRSASSPEITQAQALLLQRLATEGDVIPSRIPAPRNITEIGGYLNLLGELAENQMRHDMLASALGVTGQPLSTVVVAPLPPMRFQAVPNDKPVGAAANTVPLTVSVRSDLATGLQIALDTVHAAGGVLPLWSPPLALPSATTTPMPDPLLYLGREVWLAPTAALTDPTTDSLVLGRTATDTTAGYRVGVRVAAATPAAPVLDWSGLVWDSIGNAFVAREIGTIGLLPIEAALAGSPFVAHPIAAAPASQADTAWAKLTAIAGLVPGVTKLGDELALLWTADNIAASTFQAHLDAVWNGTAFIG